MENERITLSNIDNYRKDIKGDWNDVIYNEVINIIECVYDNELEKKNITAKDLEKISARIAESKELNNFMDNFFQEEISRMFEKKTILSEEEEPEE